MGLIEVPKVVDARGKVLHHGFNQEPFLTLEFYKEGGFRHEFSKKTEVFPDTTSEMMHLIASLELALSGCKQWAFKVLQESKAAQAGMEDALRAAKTKGIM